MSEHLEVGQGYDLDSLETKVGPLISTNLTPHVLPWELDLSTCCRCLTRELLGVAGTKSVVVKGVSPWRWFLLNQELDFFLTFLASCSSRLPLCLLAGVPSVASLSSSFS